MNGILSIMVVILFLICVVLIAKIYFMKKSVKEIELSLKDILKSNTNNLLTISSSDKDVKKLTNVLNIELKELRKQRLQY